MKSLPCLALCTQTHHISNQSVKSIEKFEHLTKKINNNNKKYKARYV